MSARRIISDTDPGQDDAEATLLALASPELELLGITNRAPNAMFMGDVDADGLFDLLTERLACP